jgi:hypothetical protein
MRVLFICAVCLLWLALDEVGAVHPTPGNYYYTAGGSSSTCGIKPCAYSSCTAGKKLVGCTGGNPGACQACTNTIPAGKYYSTYAPDEGGNCGFDTCAPCPTGQKRTGCGGGDGTSTGSCVTCGSPPTGKYWAANVDALSNCPTGDKLVCGPGFYNVGSSDFSSGACSGVCTGLTAKNYWVTPTAFDSPCTQLAQTKCDPGYVNSVVTTPQTISAGTCSPCPALTNNGDYYGPNTDSASNCPKLTCSDAACAIGEYIANCGAVFPYTSPGVCAACINAPLSSQVYDSRGGWTGNCAVIGCPTTACVLGQYMSGCGGKPTDLVCRNCANAVVGTSFYVGIGITSTCATQNCKTCSNGYYTAGCTVLADGECTGCTN